MILSELYEEVNEFIYRCDGVYLYGSGLYGAFLQEYIRQYREISGFVESSKSADIKHGSAVYDVTELAGILNENDGIILAVSEKYQREILDDYLPGFSCQLLVLENWKLYELSQFGIYKPKWPEMKNQPVGKEAYEKKHAEYVEKLEAKRGKLKELQDVYHFADWHVNTDNAYGDDVAECIAKLISEIENPLVMECGCGLCNIIGNSMLGGVRRIAIDREHSVLASDEYRFGKTIEFRHGSFEQIVEKSIDVLVTVNFVNSIPLEEVKRIYNELFKDRYIKYYIVDEVTGNYLNQYRFKELIPDEYVMSYSLGPYAADGGVRYIRVFERNGAVE